MQFQTVCSATFRGWKKEALVQNGGENPSLMVSAELYML